MRTAPGPRRSTTTSKRPLRTRDPATGPLAGPLRLLGSASCWPCSCRRSRSARPAACCGKASATRAAARRSARPRSSSSTKTYGTRQSNIRKGNGGGAIYGCRSKPGREPCIRANNLNTGRAFEFETNGTEGGRIEVKARRGHAPARPTPPGVATGFNADQRRRPRRRHGSTSGRRPARRPPTSSTSAA